MDLNVKAPFFPGPGAARRPPAPARVRRDRPRLSSIASIDGLSVNMQPTYSPPPPRRGLIHLTKRLALELAPQHIVVFRHRAGRICFQHEQARPRQGRYLSQADPLPPDRHAQDLGGRCDISRLACRRLCRGGCVGRRRRRCLDAARVGMKVTCRCFLQRESRVDA